MSAANAQVIAGLDVALGAVVEQRPGGGRRPTRRGRGRRRTPGARRARPSPSTGGPRCRRRVGEVDHGGRRGEVGRGDQVVALSGDRRRSATGANRWLARVGLRSTYRWALWRADAVCSAGRTWATSPSFAATARELGAALARRAVSGWCTAAASVGLMGELADAALAAGGEVVGVMPAHARRARDRPPRPQPARGHRLDARAQGADGGVGDGLHRPAGWVRHARRGDRDPHVEPARPDRPSPSCSSMSTATTRRCSTSSIARSRPNSCGPTTGRWPNAPSPSTTPSIAPRRRRPPPRTSGSTSTATSPEPVLSASGCTPLHLTQTVRGCDLGHGSQADRGFCR